MIVSLCDYTGIMVKPWVDAGYRAIVVDPQHPEGVTTEGQVTKVGYIIDHPETYRVLREAIVEGVSFVAGFPPCTDLAVSGARHFESKREKDPQFQAKAAVVAEQCRSIGILSGAPFFVENPISVLSSIWGSPDHIINPYEFGAYLPEDDEHPEYPDYIAGRDAYPKRTCLWVGNGFVLPEKKKVEVPEGYSSQYKSLGGKSLKTKNIRSATPRGFARAIFEKYGRSK